ncbi:vWA domain-containing protein [Halomontanus rarus]|uniref:vWA domain-containing protein n=1 Tax=Halomontanus rarus TaxID=3034020 RepID=UPI0023E7A3DD|nr:VWA domain-containing protein [Halovivax sp. TS33]
MTDERFTLSRRKALAGLGAIGAASAGAGLGTTAYFSDEESFEGNTLTAGEFDLKMDYRMTYRGGHGRLEELQQNYSNAMFVDEEMNPTDEDTGVYLLDQVPGLEDYPNADDWVRGANGNYAPFQREDLVDAGNLEEALIRIGDVKPGDYGEVTFSTHLYDNPGYMWMGGALTANNQNDYTEPEMAALEEMNLPTDEPDGEGQLADEIQAKIWYDDNCDNVHQAESGGEEGEGVDVMLSIDTSGSMGGGTGSRMENAKAAALTFTQNLGSDDRVGLVTFDNSGSLVQPLTFDHSLVEDDLQPGTQGITSGGQTMMDSGVDLAADELTDNDRDVDQVIILLGDGQPNRSARSGSNHSQNAIDAAQDAKDDEITVFTIGLSVSNGSTAQNTLIAMASGSNGTTLYYDTPDGDELDEIYSQISSVILTGEAVIAEGTLREVMAELSEGIPLDANLEEEDRVCFSPAVTRCFGFEWELPTDVGNEVQTDSVEFAIGFAAEQCRHNDGETNPFASA